MAYGVLNRHAQTLRDQQDPSIDDLLGIVTESVEAYEVCKQRIDAVEAALEQALPDPALASTVASAHDGGDQAASFRAPSRSVRPEGRTAADREGMDDDIPF
jgi:exodeoxyribonuclease VII small subunit